jgi:MFS family permease
MAPMTQLTLARVAGKQLVRVVGHAAVPVLLGPILGPVIAGAILQHATWHGLFLINLPIGILAVVLASLFLPDDDDKKEAAKGLDLIGFLLLSGLRMFRCLVLQAACALVLFIFEPSDVFRGIGEALQARFEDGGIGDLMQRRVPRMMRLLVGIVAGRVVAADHGPTGLIGGVFSRCMEQIAVEEEHIAGAHLDVNKRKTLKNHGDAFLVGASLFSCQNVVDSSEQMRTLDDLKAAIFASRRINCNECAAEIG